MAGFFIAHSRIVFKIKPDGGQLALRKQLYSKKNLVLNIIIYNRKWTSDS